MNVLNMHHPSVRQPHVFLSAFLLMMLSSVTVALAPLEIPFNTSHVMGPDGPWNFITLSVGSDPASNVSFFPLVENPFSILIGKGNCQNNDSLCQSSAEYYDTSAATAMSNPQQSLNKTILSSDNSSLYGRINYFVEWQASYYYWLEQLNAPINFDNISSIISDNWTQFSASQPYVPLSLLSVEQTDYFNISALNLTSGDRANTTTVMEESYRQGRSGSFGLHMGAAMFDQPGSLYFGGYDINRAVEPIHRVDGGVGFSLVNISFGTSSGRSPWDNGTSPPSDFALPQPMDPLLSMLPHAPYLYLPQSWCDEMASFLPVSYDADTNLYIWNTSDPLFNDIVTSPTYINFTFQQNQSFSIRAPFATLNLTLDAPLSQTSRQYFPCYGSNQVYGLGRAFLQSAIWGRAWQTSAGEYFLGQAPGPAAVNKSTTPSPVTVSRENPVYSARSGGPSWEETWQKTLTPLTEKSRRKLSGGAIAGIVIGVLVAVGLIAAAAAWWWFFVFRSRRPSSNIDGGSTRHGSHTVDGNAKTEQQQVPFAQSIDQATADPSAAGQASSADNTAAAAAVSQPPPMAKVQQLDSRERRFEADGTSVGELDGSHIRDVTGYPIPEAGPPPRHELPAPEQS